MDEFEHAIDPAEAFTAKLLDIAAQTIPTSKTHPTKHLSKLLVSSDACKECHQKLQGSTQSLQFLTLKTLTSSKMSRATARWTIREEKRSSWQTLRVKTQHTYVCQKGLGHGPQDLWENINNHNQSHSKPQTLSSQDIKNISNTLASTFAYKLIITTIQSQVSTNTNNKKKTNL